jgi:hypothetical protein
MDDARARAGDLAVVDVGRGLELGRVRRVRSDGRVLALDVPRHRHRPTVVVRVPADVDVHVVPARRFDVERVLATYAARAADQGRPADEVAPLATLAAARLVIGLHPRLDLPHMAQA